MLNRGAVSGPGHPQSPSSVTIEDTSRTRAKSWGISRRIRAEYHARPCYAAGISAALVVFVAVSFAYVLLIIAFGFAAVLHGVIVWNAGGSSRPIFFSPEEVPEALAIRAAYPAIKQDLIHVLRAAARRAHAEKPPPSGANASITSATSSGLRRFDEFEPFSRGLAVQGSWQSIFFRVYSWDVSENLAHCPGVAALLEAHPTITLAQFSVLEGPVQLRPHEGYFGGVLRVQLALLLPEGCDSGSCVLMVAGERRGWSEGQVIVFDDTHMHSVQMAAKGLRVVLFADVVRPGLSSTLRWAVGLVMRFARYVPPASTIASRAADDATALWR
eukprot:TRINITY_DN7761_c0_g1_i1.p1 TRINITY_DN7761_c0_g1~~TRINITY_DN7761_c0_g1_i1.p1  ORF type:complete len:329 (-),score=42.15 TRINITY_DN7761_c0_g1_i1:59-1045(-)